MSRIQDWLPRSPEALFNQASQTVNYLSIVANRVRMGLGDGTPQGEWFDADFTPKFDAFSSAWSNYRDPATRTKILITQLDEAEKVFNPAYRKLYTGFLKDSPLVTDDDLVAMGLPKRPSGERHPSPVAAKAPDCDTDTSVPGQVSFHYYEKEGGHKRAKPAGQHGVELAWTIGDTLPARWDELTHSSFDTRTPLTLPFENDQRGRTLYYALRWENTRGEKGTWSVIASVIIP
jgi:hypothetical protein